MSLLTRDDLQTLFEFANSPCVSLYLPTHRAGVETQQNPIRFKNLLRRAEESLSREGFDRNEIERTLEPAAKLVEDHHFWQHQSDGLAMFLSGGRSRRFRLPRVFEELVIVGDRFHVTPLLPLLTGDGRFHVLALSQKRVRLFEATRHNIQEMDLHAIPENVLDAVGYDWEQRTLQFHSGTGGPTGASNRRAMFHGHGAGDDDSKEELARFLQLVDSGILKLLGDLDSPLVVAAVDYVAAMYRDLSKHPLLAAEAIEGNPDSATPSELHERAWKIVEPRFRRDQEKAADTFLQLESAGRASGDLAEVVPASREGRVDTLFVPLGSHCWGRFDPESRTVETHESADNGDEDLLDRAALESLIRGGTVFAVEPDEMPGDGRVAAVFRY